MSAKSQGRPQTEVIRDDYLPLSRLAMSEVGPAAQTLAAIDRICGGKRGGRTFAAQEHIAEAAWLPARTVRKHLPKLVAKGWIVNHGREPLKNRWRRRRTCTYTLTDKAVNHKAPYGVLPRWAAEYLPKWSERAIYSLLAAQWLLIEKIAEDGDGCADDRIELSLTTAQRMTGLTRPSVCRAFHGLKRKRIVCRHVDGTDCQIWLEDFNVPPKGSKKVGAIKHKKNPRVSHVEPKKVGATPVKKWALPSKNLGATLVKKGAASLSAKSLSAKNYPKNNYGQTSADADADRGGAVGKEISTKAEQPKATNAEWAAARYERACQAIGYRGQPCAHLQGVCLAIAEGRLPEQILADAVEGVRIKRPATNPMGYLLTSLHNAGAMKQVTATTLPTAPPIDTQPLVRSVAATLGRERPSDHSVEEKRRQILADIAAESERKGP